MVLQLLDSHGSEAVTCGKHVSYPLLYMVWTPLVLIKSPFTQFSKTLLPQLRQVMRDHQYISHTKHADFLNWITTSNTLLSLLRDRMAAQLSRHEARLDSLSTR